MPQTPIALAPHKAPKTEPFAGILPNFFPVLYPQPAQRRSFDFLDQLAHSIDHILPAVIADFTGGLSPMALGSAFADWGIHLALSPGKQTQLIGKASRKFWRFFELWLANLPGGRDGHFIEPLPQDHRFAAKEWEMWPYTLIWQGFLLQQQWWHNATTGVAGVTKQHENVVEFMTRQFLDMLSPSNFILTNPVVQKRTLETGGMNLLRGAMNFVDDAIREVAQRPPAGAEAFEVGRDVATTPGKVVFRNRLIELIQYAPQTAEVEAEPILFVPAWIMKYYILDLSQGNSLVRHLVAQGFTVFMISWLNPGENDRDLSMEDYRHLGIMAAIEAIEAILPDRKIHAAGYCLGGTELAIAAASMGRDKDDHLQSLTLFAAQTDFTEAGELMIFINESQIAFLEAVMHGPGYLDSRQMAGAFQFLHPNDLIWSKMIHDYLMGEHEKMFDLMAWNADATRMPDHMHSEYLRRLFLDNDLAEGRYKTDDLPVALSDIRVPIFAVGTEHDHVAPWHSVFKIELLTNVDVTFVLASGGHNAGIVSPPGLPGRHFRVHTKKAQDIYLDPESWVPTASEKTGSWWPEWVGWLKDHSSGLVAAPKIGNEAAGYPALEAAPGTYVHMR